MRAIFPLMLVVALAFPVGADHCTIWTTSAPEVTLDAYYVDNDLCQPDCSRISLYEESNGIDGLQRQDEMVDDTCHGAISPDRLIKQLWY